MFEVDPSWPKVPDQMESRRSVGISPSTRRIMFGFINRPRTLKPDQAAMATPPVMEFDMAGNFIKGWGGCGQRH